MALQYFSLNTQNLLSKSRDYLNFKISSSMVLWGSTQNPRIGINIILSWKKSWIQQIKKKKKKSLLRVFLIRLTAASGKWGCHRLLQGGFHFSKDNRVNLPYSLCREFHGPEQQRLYSPAQTNIITKFLISLSFIKKLICSSHRSLLPHPFPYQIRYICLLILTFNDGVQNMPSQNMLLWHIDWFELKALEKQYIQTLWSLLPAPIKAGAEIPKLKISSL